jgi:hypothetical protein
MPQKSGATTMPLVDAAARSDGRDVERAVREFLEAPTPSARAARSMGKVKLLQEVWAYVDDSAWPEETVEIRRIDVDRIDGDEAVVELDAVRSWSHAVSPGHVSHRTKYSGPVRLHRLEGRWLVVDYLMDGDVVSETVHAVEGGDERDAVGARAVCADFSSRGLMVFVSLYNLRKHPVLIDPPRLRVRGPLGLFARPPLPGRMPVAQGTPWAPLELPAGGERTVAFGWPSRVRPSPGRIGLAFVVGDRQVGFSQLLRFWARPVR